MPGARNITESLMDPVMLDLFWKFVAERQLVWYRRSVLGLEAPWTTDPIIQNEFITNIYRELDPGTQYAINEILEKEADSLTDKIFSIFVFRIMGSQEWVHKEITSLIKTKSVKKDKLFSKFQELAAGGNNIFGNAYRVAPYDKLGGGSKVENVSILLAKLAGDFKATHDAMKTAHSAQKLFEVITSTEGIGKFLAFQIMCDLLYPLDYLNGQPMFPYSHNDYVVPGPGSVEGIRKLLNPGVGVHSHATVIEWLRDNQDEGFEKAGAPFLYLANLDGTPKKLHLADIQSCLCEFNKYSRIWKGDVKLVRKFRQSSTREQILQDIPIVIDPVASKMEGVSTVVVRALTPMPPSGGYHLDLASPTVTGGEQLVGAGTNNLQWYTLSPKTPLDYALQLTESGLVRPTAVGVIFHNGKAHTVVLHGPEDLVLNVGETVMISPVALPFGGSPASGTGISIGMVSNGIAEINNSTIDIQNNTTGTAPTEIESDND